MKRKRKLTSAEAIELHHRMQGLYLPTIRTRYNAFDPHSMRAHERKLARVQKRLGKHRKSAAAYEVWHETLERDRKNLKSRIAYFDRFLQTPEGREWLRKEKHALLRSKTRGSR